MSREGLYKERSADGNPTFAMLVRITRALGMQVRIKLEARRPAAQVLCSGMRQEAKVPKSPDSSGSAAFGRIAAMAIVAVTPLLGLTVGVHAAERQLGGGLSTREEGKALPGEACRVAGPDLPNQWTVPESWAWREICEGRNANFNLRLGVPLDVTNSAHDRAWGDGRRTLSSGFLKAILLHEPFRTAIPDRGAIIVGAYFPESVDLSDAVLGRPLALRGSWFQGSALFARLTTPSSFSLAASKALGRLDMDSASIGGNLLLRDARFAEVRLSGARISGQLDMDRSGVGGRLDMASVAVGDELFMRKTKLDGEASLIYLNVGSVLDVGGAELATLDLTGSRISTELRFRSPDGDIVVWKAGDDGEVGDRRSPRLILRNVTTGALRDSKDAWPSTVELDGLSYDHLGGFGALSGRAPYHREVDWLIGWLESDTTYTPGPYRRLAHVLRTSGDDSRADAILVALQDRRLAHDGTPLTTKIGLSLSWALLYYGYGVWLAAVWFIGLVLVGWLVLRASRGEWSWQGFFYSLAMAVPLVNLTPINEKFSRENRKASEDRYFQCHKILGLVFVSALVAGLTGLVN